jgi:Amt family ammonium transporter
VVKGLFYGGGTGQLRAQVIGSLTAVVAVTTVTLLIMYTIKAIRGSWTLRVSRDGELEGLDIHEHGTPAYHMEFGQGMTYSTPANLPTNGAPLPPVPAEKSAEPV